MLGFSSLLRYGATALLLAALPSRAATTGIRAAQATGPKLVFAHFMVSAINVHERSCSNGPLDWNHERP